MAPIVMKAMFVQGFWFGAKLVRENEVGPGDVMAVFWACLIAATNLQMCIPQFITLTKGKFAMAALLGTVADSKPTRVCVFFFTHHLPQVFTKNPPSS